MNTDVWTHLASKKMSIHASGLVLAHTPDSTASCELCTAIVSTIPAHLNDANINLGDLMTQAKIDFFAKTRH